jgi:hypothetical protein
MRLRTSPRQEAGISRNTTAVPEAARVLGSEGLFHHEMTEPLQSQASPGKMSTKCTLPVVAGVSRRRDPDIVPRPPRSRATTPCHDRRGDRARGTPACQPGRCSTRNVNQNPQRPPSASVSQRPTRVNDQG